MKVERNIEIAVEPAVLYEILMDPDCLERWVTIHDGWKELPAGDLREGSELVQKLKIAGQGFKVTWHVVQADCPKRVVWEGDGPMGTKARVTYELAPNGKGTKFKYVNEYELPGGPFGKAAGGAIKGASGREADKSLERLKEFVEG